MTIREVSPEEFASLEEARKVIVHDHPRRYAVVELESGGGQLGLCWRSDQIEPEIQPSPDRSLVWIGVDQRLSAVERASGKARFSMNLEAPLLQFVADENFLVALTEIEAIVFNWEGSVRATKELPELPDTAAIENRVLVVHLVDGQTVTLKF